MDVGDFVNWPFGPVAGLVVGSLLLFAGRRLFWFLVGAVGFLLGFYLAGLWLDLQPPWLALLAGLLVGIGGAFLAVLVQRAAIAVAGFLVGGSLAVRLAEAAFQPLEGEWLIFLIAGVASAVVLVLVFEAALIVLSSLFGAALVLDAVPLEGAEGALPFLILAAVGMAAQAFTRPGKDEAERERRRKRERERDMERRRRD